VEVGGIYKFCGNRGKFINFVETGGEYAMCIIGLGRWMPLGKPWLQLCLSATLPTLMPLHLHYQDKFCVIGTTDSICDKLLSPR